MPAPNNSSEFLQLLDASNLADKAQARAALGDGATLEKLTPSQLADRLVRAKLITAFQAEQLLAGRHRGFFIGKYKILELLGSGGMGRVYLAEHSIMRRQVALKVLPKGKSSDPSALARFQREARAVAALRHPNIVQAYDIDQEGDIHYIVMEYVAGLSVQEYVRRHGPVPYALAADIIQQAADALDHASQAGLVHRDIKPGNLVIDATGTVKLLDMGLAVFFEEKERDPLTLTYDENVLGTADYLAPEQALDSHNVDIRADIYSLGGTFYFLITGRPPFPDGTIAQKLLWHQNKEPRPARELVADLPAAVDAVLKRMMAKDPARRFQIPAEVRDALAPHARRMDGKWLVELTRRAPAGGDSSSARREPADGSGNKDSAVVLATPAGDPSASETEAGPRAIRSRPGGASRSAPPSPPVAPTTSSAPATPARRSHAAGRPARAAVPIDSADASNVLAASASPSSATATSVEDSADFLRSLAEAPSSPSASRLGPGTDSSTRIVTDRVRGAWRALSARVPDDRKIWVLGGAGAGAGLLILVVAAYLLTRDADPGVPAATVQLTVPMPARDPNILVVAKDPLPNEFLLDEAIFDVRADQTIELKGSGPTTWEVPNLKVGAEGIAGRNVTLRGWGADTVLRLSKSLDGAVLAINSASGFAAASLTLDGRGKPGPVLEITGEVPGLWLKDVTIKNFKGVGVRLSGAHGSATAPIRFERVTVECADPKGRPIVFGPGPAESPPGRSYHVNFEDCHVRGPFAAGITIQQPVNTLALRGGIIGPGTVGLTLAAKDSEWKKTLIYHTRFESLARAVVSEVGLAAIGEIDWRAPAFENVKEVPKLAVPFQRVDAPPAKPAETKKDAPAKDAPAKQAK